MTEETELTAQEVNEQETIQKIKKMSQVQLASLWRFAKPGHPYFDCTLPYLEVFNECFEGFTPQISKQIGWG